MALTQVSTGGIKDGQVQTADLADGQVTVGKLHADALDRTYTLGADGSNHYTFTGEGLTGAVNDPTLYLTRGKTYRFVNGNSSGAHPFRIQTTVNGSAGTEYNTGVTNNGGAGGSTIVFEVPHDAPDILYYQCTSHGSMGGILYVTGALADGTVTTAKLAADAVNGTKLADNAVNSEHITDQAVTLAKLPHGTSSNDGKFLRANNGADPSFETVSIPAGTTINGNTDHQVITGTGTSNTLQGESSFTHNVSTYDTTIQHNVNTSNDLIVQNDNSGTAAGARFTLQSGSNANTGPQEQFIVGSHSWLRQVPKSSGNMTLAKNGTIHTSFNASGDLSIANGNLVLASGHGIDFSAFGNHAGMTSELLDDYEEGTFTPYPVNGWGILNGSATTQGSAADVAQGKYVKIGSTVYVFFTFKEGNSSGASFQGTKILFYGMPFQAEGQYGTGSDVESHPLNGFGNNLSSNGIGLFFRPDSSGSTVGGCHAQTSGGQTDFTGQHLSNTGQIWFHGTYKVHP